MMGSKLWQLRLLHRKPSPFRAGIVRSLTLGHKVPTGTPVALQNKDWAAFQVGE